MRMRCPASAVEGSRMCPVPSQPGCVRPGEPLPHAAVCPQPCGRSLNSILGKSNLKFAGMPITLTISTSSLNLMASDCKQVRVGRCQGLGGWLALDKQESLCPPPRALLGQGMSPASPRDDWVGCVTC